MKNHDHPGTLIWHDCLEPLGLNVTAASEWLGIGRPSLSEVLNGHAGISPSLALRLEAAGWGTAEGWLSMQLNHDLARAKQRLGGRIRVKRYPVPQPA